MNYHNLINDLAELEAEIRQALVSPDEIRRSSRDPNVLLFYLVLKERRWAVAVARRLNGDGFLITAYQKKSSYLLESRG